MMPSNTICNAWNVEPELTSRRIIATEPSVVTSSMIKPFLAGRCFTFGLGFFRCVVVTKKFVERGHKREEFSLQAASTELWRSESVKFS